MNITAIVPVKKESGRLKNKNILPFGESNLLVHKINQLKNTPKINNIVVSSDSDFMLEIAEKEGVIPLKRPKDLADESRPFCDFIDYLCREVEGDHFVYACVTSPLVDSDTYSDAIETYMSKLNDGYDSLITVLPFKHFLMDEYGTFNFKRAKGHVNSQDLPQYWVFTNGIIIAPRESMADWHYHFGINPYYYEVRKDVAVDIDDIYDYEYAIALYNLNRRG